MGSTLEQKPLSNFGRRNKPAGDSALSFAIASSDWATVYERWGCGGAIGGSEYSSYFKGEGGGQQILYCFHFEGRLPRRSLLLGIKFCHEQIHQSLTPQLVQICASASPL